MSDANESLRADIVTHPLFNDFLAAHMACHRVSTPDIQQFTVNTLIVDHFPTINPSSSNNCNPELDHFMVSYTAMLSSLEKNIQTCMTEANMGFHSIEQELFRFTGTRSDQGVIDISYERMKKELRMRLQQIQEEITRKNKAYRMPAPNNVSSVLKKWFGEHLDWPYPTSDEKEMLMRETGLKPKQLNKWFINQRNRKWK